MRAKTQDELRKGDEIAVFQINQGKRQLNVHRVTEITSEDVIVDDLWDISPNEDGHFFVLPKL